MSEYDLTATGGRFIASSPCYKCGSSGHLAENCRSNVAPEWMQERARRVASNAAPAEERGACPSCDFGLPINCTCAASAGAEGDTPA